MLSLIRLFIVYREARRHFDRGQTMTEYALILAAVGIAVFVEHRGGPDATARAHPCLDFSHDLQKQL